MAWSAEIWTGAISCTRRTKICKKEALHRTDAALFCFSGEMQCGFSAGSDRAVYLKILCHLLHIGGGKLAQGQQ